MVNFLKVIDKFLKLLKTDRNTFATFILTLLTGYIVIDRIIEILLIVFTGVSVSYWGPIKYTLALACPVFAFLFSGSSKFVTSDEIKVSFFYSYIVALYILIVSMVIQWLNAACWIGLLSLPNYHIIATEFGTLIKPALSSLAIYIPIVTFYPILTWIMTTVNDTKDIRDSIIDYGGISLSRTPKEVGQYSCEIELFKDKETGKVVKLPEIRRFNQMLVVGISGSGKTSMIFEPMIARDIDKKFFFKEAAKELSFVALKSGIAKLNSPYDNDYINENFNLNMISPADEKEDVFKSYFKKMIYNIYDGKPVYKNLGITYMCPDYESISRILNVAKCYKTKVNLIDPNNKNSPGLNPFAFSDPLQTSVAISNVLKGLYTNPSTELEFEYRENFSTQAIENLTILLKEMYPRLNSEELPTLEDLLNLLNNFDLVENMCKELEQIPELAKQYSLLISYFKKNFYADAPGRQDTERFVYSATTQLDNLLRHPGVRAILCNRTDNLNYDNALANGEITLVCTRRGDLGASTHKAFGLFFLMLMQYSVLRRPGTEDTRIPHFLYIDEFPDFICSSTESIFTLYRKYKVGTVISAQNLSQISDSRGRVSKTIIANCANKIVFGNNSPEDNEWWEKELGDIKAWKFGNSYDTEKGKYDAKLTGISFGAKPKYAAGKVQSLKGKQCMYKIKDGGNKNVVGTASLDFIPAKYKETKSIHKYNFEKYLNNSSSSSTRRKASSVFSDSNNSDNENDPIKIDNSDAVAVFDNEDPIFSGFKKFKA